MVTSRLIGPTPSPIPTQRRRQPSPAPKRRRLVRHAFRPATARSKFAGDWKQIGEQSPSNAQVAWLAGYSPSSSSYANPRSALKPSGLIEYPSPAPDSARRQFCHCRARPIRFCGGTRTTMKPAFSHSSRSAPGRAQRPEKKRASVIRSPITGSVRILRDRFEQSQMDICRRRRADPCPAPHHGIAHAAQDRKPQGSADAARPQHHRDHSRILRQRDRRGCSRGNGSHDERGADRTACDREEKIKKRNTAYTPGEHDQAHTDFATFGTTDVLATFWRKNEVCGCCGRIAQGTENCKVGRI